MLQSFCLSTFYKPYLSGFYLKPFNPCIYTVNGEHLGGRIFLYPWMGTKIKRTKYSHNQLLQQRKLCSPKYASLVRTCEYYERWLTIPVKMSIRQFLKQTNTTDL